MSPATLPPASKRPDWLKPRGSRPPQPPAVPLIDELPSSGAPPEGFAAWVAELRALFTQHFRQGLMLSICVHLVLIALLSLIVFRMPSRSDVWIEGFSGNGGGDLTELDVPGKGSLDTELSAAAATPVDFVDLSATLTARPDLMGGMFGALGAEGASDTGNGTGGTGAGGGFGNIRMPASAVTKGSFTVWTDPEDPEPGREYDIVIQVKLPRSLTSYKLRDLTGTVHGTDKYFKAIQYNASDRKPVKDGIVQVRVPIPGAAVRVRDTIKIRSQILKEEQTIEIVF